MLAGLSMPKLDSKPINKNDLIDYLSSTDDFRFEIDVFRSCVQCDRSAEHGGTYQDPVTGKDRQFDIRMKLVRGTCVLRLAVECKNLKPNYPLLISRVPRRREEAYHEAIRVGRDALFSYTFPPADTVYNKGELVGKSTTQVGRTTNNEITSGDADVYDKWSQALASSLDLLWLGSHEPEARESEFVTTVVLPVLVVADDTLWAVDYSPTGELTEEPRQLSDCTIFIGKKYSFSTSRYLIEHRLSHLHVFTKKGFDAFLQWITQEDNWEDFFRFTHFPSSTKIQNMGQGK